MERDLLPTNMEALMCQKKLVIYSNSDWTINCLAHAPWAALGKVMD